MMQRPGIRFCALALLVAAAAPGVTPAEIRVGMTGALSGPAQELGRQMKLGIEAGFAEANETGAVHGESLRLIVRDDGYEPARAAPNMRSLVTEDKVIAVIGNVGTPTAIVTVPIANEMRTLLFGAYSGADVLRRQPPDRYVINYRASYAEEAAAMIDMLLGSGIRPEEIAFFTQRDGFGDDGYQGAVEALRARGFEEADRLVHARYTRNTVNVEDAVAQLLDAEVQPRAVIIVGGYLSSAKFVRLARRELPNLKFLHVSFAGAGALAKELGPDGEGVIVTQVVPGPDSDLPVVADYRRALERYAPSEHPGFVSLEGYITARIFIEALRRAGPKVDSETLVDTFESMQHLDIGLGEPVSFSATSHQAVHKVWATVIRGGRFVPLLPPAPAPASVDSMPRATGPTPRGATPAVLTPPPLPPLPLPPGGAMPPDHVHAAHPWHPPRPPL